MKKHHTWKILWITIKKKKNNKKINNKKEEKENDNNVSLKVKKYLYFQGRRTERQSLS